MSDFLLMVGGALFAMFISGIVNYKKTAWVGLTDEQIEAIAEEFGVGGWICDFARAIEAGLKEKNDC